MPIFDFKFTVSAPVTAVSAFHHDTSALKKLTPPPVYMQVHTFEPMAEGSRAHFTMWIGPIPLHWQAIHTDVSLYGFTDTQFEGPNRSWTHTHRFEPLPNGKTQVHEHIEFEYGAGLLGAFTRLLFNPLALRGLFTYRMLVTRWGVKKIMEKRPELAHE